MKNLYFRSFVLLACLIFFYQSSLYAQCLCTGGIPATAIDQTITISPTTTSTLVFGFQQFNPAIGNLSCVSLHDTITGNSVTGALNTGPLRTAFLFQLTLVNQITGPGISISNIYSATHGIDTLDPFGVVPTDSITYGPENIITNPNGFATAGGNAAYLGLGTVNFTYDVNGGMITIQGGSNYKSSVTTVIGGILHLTYYWCPTVPLGTAISNFSAYKQNGKVSLQWLGTIDQNGIEYEIEYSKDNENWQPAGTVPAGSAPTGTVAQFQYQYNTSQTDMGEIYFRIKRIDSEGNAVYSVVKAVNLQQADQRPGIQIYPNPVNQNILVQFDEQQTGNFSLELVNAMGQIIERKQVQLSGSSMTNMGLSTKPASGIYFLRAVNPANNKQFLTKVIVN
jgi:Secretion system C-terminal sorting domain